MIRKLKYTVLFLILGVVLVAQTPVKNPTVLTFTSPDHDNTLVTGYELDIVNSTTLAVVQTLNVPKSSTTKLPNGDIRIGLNVQPVNFGSYKIIARTVTATVKSDNSVPSDTWERAPGPPSKPIPQ